MVESDPDQRASAPPPKASAPPPEERMQVRRVDAPHPSVLDEPVLQTQIEMRAQRRSGPGGQHRNKTSSGVFLTHRPSGIVAEATERRSQAANRSTALLRLRLALAVELRTPSVLDIPENVATDASGNAGAEKLRPSTDPVEHVYRETYSGTSLRIGRQSASHAAVLALLLNDLHAAGGQPSIVAGLWDSSTSGLVRFTKSHAPAFLLLNRIRGHHGRPSLK